jgi:Putative zinc- or iron-chelating domain
VTAKAKPPRAAKRSLPVAGTRTRWTPDLLAGVAEGERRALRPLFDRGPEGAVAAAAAASDRAAELDRAARATEPPATPIACAKGCPSCCVSKVAVVAPEVLRIAEHLRRNLDPEPFAALVARVRAADEQTRGLSRAERARAGVPCPLLVEGACSVHEVRPLLCRGWSSLDVAACERHFADPDGTPVAPGYRVGYELASAVLAGLGRAALDAGRDGRLLELVAALRMALERPTAAARWDGRLPVFSQALDAEAAAGPDPG